MPGGWVPPIPRDPPCPACRPHPWHLLACSDECPCDHPPIPGVDSGQV